MLKNVFASAFALILLGCGDSGGGGSSTNTDFATYLATGQPRSLNTEDFGKLAVPCENTTQLAARFTGHKCVYMYVDDFYQTDRGTGIAEGYPTASIQSIVSNSKTYFTDASLIIPIHIIVIMRSSITMPSGQSIGTLNGSMHFYVGSSTIPSFEL